MAIAYARERHLGMGALLLTFRDERRARSSISGVTDGEAVLFGALSGCVSLCGGSVQEGCLPINPFM